MIKINTESKTYQAIKLVANQLLTSKVLVVDPSTGSKSSLPGYAYFINGKLTESGVISVSLDLNRSEKLYEISRTIREDFDRPDILIVEYIPPVSYKGGMNSNAVMALQKSIGAIIAAHPFRILLEIPAVVWKKYVNKEYVKSDEADAVFIGICAMEIAKYSLTHKDVIEC